MIVGLLKLRTVRWMIGVLGTVALWAVAAVAGIVILLVTAVSAAPAGAAGLVSTQGWANPVVGRIVSPFGPRVAPCPGCSTFHEGDDIGAPCNAPIHAARAGTVIKAGPYGDYGNFIEIDSGDGLSTAYGHIVDGGIHVAIGDQVTAGQFIGNVGATGDATGCHLHFEIRLNNEQVDPVPIMLAGGITLGVDL